MNTRGQSGILGFLIYIGVFIIVWALFLADLLTWVGQNAIESGNFNGTELFVLTNLNLVVLIAVIITLGAFSLGGRQ